MLDRQGDSWKESLQEHRTEATLWVPRYIASDQVDNESIDKIGTILIDMYKSKQIFRNKEEEEEEGEDEEEDARVTSSAALPESGKKVVTIGVATVYGDAITRPISKRTNRQSKLGKMTLYYREEYGLRMLLQQYDLPCSAEWEAYVERIAGSIPAGTVVNSPLVSIPELSARGHLWRSKQ
eukprot:GEZU01042999.1.p1 GENE.GEZU01042999.1~~GEZU01042999.1.p1  ORF type:complete len:181 (+),score=27.67 GEZU01042999.1:180-722(+)